MLNHHAAAACSPTRAMLLTGTDAHLGGLGVLIEYKQSAEGAKRYSGKAGYEGFLNGDVATLPEILEDNGYFTAMSGKVSYLTILVELTSSGILVCEPRRDRGKEDSKKHLRCSQGAATTMAGSPRNDSLSEAVQSMLKGARRLICMTCPWSS